MRFCLTRAVSGVLVVLWTHRTLRHTSITQRGIWSGRICSPPQTSAISFSTRIGKSTRVTGFNGMYTLEPRVRLELTACWLLISCSTTEPSGHFRRRPPIKNYLIDLRLTKLTTNIIILCSRRAERKGATLTLPEWRFPATTPRISTLELSPSFSFPHYCIYRIMP